MTTTPHSLRRTLAVQIGLMIAGLLLVGAGALWGISGLHADFGAALRANRELHDIYEVGYHVTTAKLAIENPRPDTEKAFAEAGAALSTFDRYAANNAWLSESQPDQTQLRAALEEAVSILRPRGSSTRSAIAVSPLAAGALDRALGQLVHLSNDVQQTIIQRGNWAEGKRKFALWFVLILCGVVVVGAVVLGARQYRGVVRPLDRLSAAAARIASRQFTGPIDTTGPGARDLGAREFLILAGDFNRMAEALDAFYRELEEKVRIKSRELVRSERLASVGYLAAGVAHEINNPLGIIAGYAESALQSIERTIPSGGSATAPEIEKALRIICEEAFRCKEITDRLLALSRGGGEDRNAVDLAAVARGVIANLQGLRNFAAGQVKMEIDASRPLLILGKEGEMKQVVLNLVLNALDAVSELPPAERKVLLRIHRIAAARPGESADTIELSITDNGRGMAADVAERVFEPFFSASGRGTGLGLSITHAIIADHNGQIRAASDGPGKGSRFTIAVPAVEKS